MSPMPRLIRRYESRKLYDTEESRYVALEEVATWVRLGQEVRVIDIATDADATAQTLTQIILDEGKRGSTLPSELLHDLVRRGERVVVSGAQQVKEGVEGFVQRSIDRLAPVQKAREEMADLKARLADLEASLAEFADSPLPAVSAKSRRAPTVAKAAKKPAGTSKKGARK
jgi:polyhydroxyalkanoate synthesis repressor PhaR